MLRCYCCCDGFLWLYKVARASASTFSGLVVRTASGDEGLPKDVEVTVLRQPFLGLLVSTIDLGSCKWPIVALSTSCFQFASVNDSLIVTRST